MRLARRRVSGVADHGVIAAVSETLEAVLTQALSTLLPLPAPVAELHDLGPGNIPLSPARLTLFLFETIEDPSARNRPRIVSNVPPNVTREKPPMALLLKYLLTPWSPDRLTDHRILGRAMQVLYDGAIISGPLLQGSLAGSADALKVTLAPLTLEERTRIWHAVQRSYRLSVTYEVRVVNLDTEKAEILQPVSRRTLDYAGPEATQ